MTRDAFMRELEYLLQDVQDDEKDEALQYYRDYFDEAGPENEEQVIQEFGSPERIAAIIRSDIAGNLEDGGAFTESGYTDERFRDPGYQVAHRYDLPEAGGEKGRGKDPADGGGKTESRTSKVLKIALILVLLAVALPVAWGIGHGLWGLAGCLLALLIVLLVFLGLATVGFLIAGVVMIPWGIVMAFGSPWSGLVVFGSGLIMAGLGLLGLALCVLFYGRFVPFLIRSVADFLNRFFHKNRRDNV